MEQTATGVKGLLVRDGKVLVLVKPDGTPDLPGGRVEQGERPEESLHREIFEETGLIVEILYPVAWWVFPKGPDLRVQGTTYLCRPSGGSLRLSPEHHRHDWVGGTEIDQIGWPYLGRYKHAHFSRA